MNRALAYKGRQLRFEFLPWVFSLNNYQDPDTGETLPGVPAYHSSIVARLGSRDENGHKGVTRPKFFGHSLAIPVACIEENKDDPLALLSLVSAELEVAFMSLMDCLDTEIAKQETLDDDI